MRPSSSNSLTTHNNNNNMNFINSQNNQSTSIYSSSSSNGQSSKRQSAANISLNIARPHSYLGHPINSLQQEIDNDKNQLNQNEPTTISSTNYNQLDSSILSTASNFQSLNQSKFQFDFYINKIEISVPSPIYVFVQVLKGTHQLNTKKKLKVDPVNKVATFNEKLSIVTCLNRAQNSQQMMYQNYINTNNDDQPNNANSNNGYQSKSIQLRLFAFYNSKEKAIGICSVDLSQFITPGGQKVAHRATFQKCFDKNATISFEVRAKEQFSSIKEQIVEETENSNLYEGDSQLALEDNQSQQPPESFRSFISQSQDLPQFQNLPAYLNTEEELQVQDFDSDSNTQANQSEISQKQTQQKLNTSNAKPLSSKDLRGSVIIPSLSSRNSTSAMDMTPQSKTQPHKYYEAALKSQRTQVIQKSDKNQQSPGTGKTLNSARSSLALSGLSSTQNQINNLHKQQSINSNSSSSRNEYINNGDLNNNFTATPTQQPSKSFITNSATMVISQSKQNLNNNANLQSTTSGAALDSSRNSTPTLIRSQQQNTTPSNSDSQQLHQSQQQSIRRLEERVKMLEYENKTLKQENQEQKQKIVTLEILQKEERMREYELKCNEADSYKQRASSLEASLRQLQSELSSFEQERLVIVESYERKLQDMRSQTVEQQSLISGLQLQNLQYKTNEAMTLNTVESSTQADEEPQSILINNKSTSPALLNQHDYPNLQFKSNFQQQQDLYYQESDNGLDSVKQKLTFDETNTKSIPILAGGSTENGDGGYKELYEKLMSQYQYTVVDQQEQRKRADMLEKQLMKSKEQIVQLANELYSLEKESIYDDE